MHQSIRISLAPEEYRALARLAERELRPIPLQAQRLVIEALQRERLLPPQPVAKEATDE